MSENGIDKLAATTAERDAAKLIEAATMGVKYWTQLLFHINLKLTLNTNNHQLRLLPHMVGALCHHNFGVFPQKRPPACIPTEKTAATVMPIYDKSTPVDSLEWTKVGSIPSNMNITAYITLTHYYPGWIAQDSTNDPLSNGKKYQKQENTSQYE